ncbi:MAG: hypothetical protein GEU96_18235 [Propionibacteriales bacterium]|nr:hypothetical protein [Propionibacteriales bacterium]
MGYTTDFIGHIDIQPSLNEAERTYLTAFAASRRWRRPGGRYAVPLNPAAAHDDFEGGAEDNGERYNQPPPGQPGLWCQWVPCRDGCCLSFNGYEKFYEPTKWMAYLIDHFLAPGAQARRSKLELLQGFTFDHRLDGIIAACRRDTKELYLICVDDNDVTEEVLRPADDRYVDYPPLAYEAYADAENARRPRRRPKPALRVVGDAT